MDVTGEKNLKGASGGKRAQAGAPTEGRKQRYEGSVFPKEWLIAMRYDIGNARYPPCEIALHIRSDPLVETVDPGYLTPEPSSAGGSCAFFSDTSSIRTSLVSEPPTPRCASMPSSPVRESQPPSPSQLAALATYPPGTSRLQAAALREMSSAPEPDSPSSAHRDDAFRGSRPSPSGGG